MSMRKILVTGAAGFVPSSLIDQLLLDSRTQVVGVDNMLTGKYQNLPKAENFTFIKCNVNDWQDISSVMQAMQFDYVFHYAAVVGVRRTLENPLMVLDDVKGIENILKLCKNTGVQRVFFSSSSEVYGEPVEFPQNELTTPLNSKLPYAIVKNIGEAYLKSYHLEHGLNYTIFRFFNTYGPKQSTDFVLSKFINAALFNKDITIYGDGSQTRTFCYIDDNVQATLKCLNDQQYINEVLNIGSDKEISIRELAILVKEVTGSASKIVHLPALTEGDMTRRQPDNGKMVTLLGRELLPLQNGIEKILKAWSHKASVKERLPLEV
jgi:nucleoside-diphosphate-sugar epimerase